MREIDLEYLESLPTVLEIKGLTSQDTASYQSFIVENLIQPSFVGRIFVKPHFPKHKFVLIMPFGFVLEITPHKDDSFSIAELSVCCLAPIDIYGRTSCNKCHKYGLSVPNTKSLAIFAVSPRILQAGENKDDNGEYKCNYELSQVLQDRGIDTFNAVLIAGELWAFIYAYGFWNK